MAPCHLSLHQRRRIPPLRGDAMSGHWYRHSPDETLALLGSSTAGLSGVEARRRFADHGANAIIEAPARSTLALLTAQFVEVPIMVLLGAAVISLLIGHWADAGVIATIVLLNAAIGFFQEY